VTDDKQGAAQVHVAGPEGRPPTREEAEAMAQAMFEALTGRTGDEPPAEPES
jgi:hypothetical protein